MFLPSRLTLSISTFLFLYISDFLSIGLPSVRRVNGCQYLLQTIQSLIEETPYTETQTVVIIIFLADFNSTYNGEVANILKTRYQPYIDIGLLQILRVEPSIYPQLTNLKHNFNDTDDRVQWRSKQVIDYAILLSHARNQSLFYMQLEDDVYPANAYLSTIRNYIQTHQKHTWALLEFSELGFIGKLFKTSDIPKLITLLVTFYEELPVDWMMEHYCKLMGQTKRYMHKPSIFQHFGLNSSLMGKQSNLTDRHFPKINQRH